MIDPQEKEQLISRLPVNTYFTAFDIANKWFPDASYPVDTTKGVTVVVNETTDIIRSILEELFIPKIGQEFFFIPDTSNKDPSYIFQSCRCIEYKYNGKGTGLYGHELLPFSLSEQGGKIWLGDANERLYCTDVPLTFERVHKLLDAFSPERRGNIHTRLLKNLLSENKGEVKVVFDLESNLGVLAKMPIGLVHRLRKKIQDEPDFKVDLSMYPGEKIEPVREALVLMLCKAQKGDRFYCLLGLQDSKGLWYPHFMVVSVTFTDFYIERVFTLYNTGCYYLKGIKKDRDFGYVFRRGEIKIR